MRIALVGHKPAYPKVDGGCVASAAFLQNLVDAGCEVYYNVLSTEKHPYLPKKFPDELQNSVHIESVAVDTTLHAGSALKHLFSRKSYNVERFFSPAFEALLEKQCDEIAFDAVIFDNVFPARYAHVFQKKEIPCYVRTHNVESEIWSMLANEERNPLKKRYLRRLASDLKRFEIEVLSSVDGIFSITQDDLEEFRKLGISTPAVVAPVSIPLPDYTHDYSNSNLFHLGSMNWMPNVETVQQALEIHQRVREKLPESVFTIAGSDSKTHFSSDEAKGIHVVGFVDSIPDFLQSQGILFSPTVSGSGVRIKILEMMAYGIPVISSTLGAQGIANTSGVQIADTEEDMIAAVYQLASDENKRRELGNKAKSIISLHYDPKKISDNILEFLQRP